jgi:hypothetical protein
LFLFFDFAKILKVLFRFYFEIEKWIRTRKSLV